MSENAGVGMKRRPLIAVCLVAALALGGSRSAPAADDGPVQLTARDRVLVLAPHPDDETIGAGGIIQAAARMKIPLKIVYLTNGDSNEVAFLVYKKRPVLRRDAVLAMGEMRRVEAVKAMTLLGVRRDQLVFLGYPDGGTLMMFNRYWDGPSYKGVLTRVRSVPYPEAKSFRAPYTGQHVLNDLKDILTEFRPTKIFVSHPADTNVDHRALPLYLRVALWDVEERISRPEIYPYLVHHRNFPDPRGYWPQKPLDPPPEMDRGSQRWRRFPLPSTDVERKFSAVMAYRSQVSYNPNYLVSFARGNELFGRYPPIVLRPVEESAVTDGDNGTALEHESAPAQGRPEAGTVIYARRGDSVVITLRIPGIGGLLNGANIFLNGYRRDVPFGDMPKYRIHVRRGGTAKVYNRHNPVMVEGVTVTRQGNDLTVTVPLDILERPEYILACVRGGRTDGPDTATAWRVLEVPDYERR